MRFAQDLAGEDDAQLGLAPLLDVVLLLLIFFVVTTSFTERRIPVELPDAQATAAGETDTLRVTITADGSLHVDGEASSLPALEERLAGSPPDTQLELRAHEAVSHGRVVEVLDLAARNGVTGVGIAVDAARGERPGE